jgi:undecaprenyl diphosphate synthase
MDGNGRWAKKRGLPRIAGHRAGANTLQNITEYCNKLGIKALTVYAFSTENWKRPENEVKSLLDLMLEYLIDSENRLAGKNVKIKIIGDISVLPSEMQKQISKTEDLTCRNTGIILNIAINYGGRNEIIYAVKKLAKDIKSGIMEIEDINEELIARNLYTKEIGDPDLIIRPSGELRLSNFLLWQCAYSEFWYSKILWPDFKEKDMLIALLDYQNRNRRFGGI